MILYIRINNILIALVWYNLISTVVELTILILIIVGSY